MNDRSLLLLGATALLYGLRHGIDWDHLAAITDLTGGQDNRRHGLKLASGYAAGHGIVVFALGLAGIFGSHLLPEGLDELMSRVVGATLIILSITIVIRLVRERRDFRLRSRWMLIAEGVLTAGRWAKRQIIEVHHDHPHIHDHRHTHAHENSRVHSHAHDNAGQPEASSHDRAGVVTVTHRHHHVHRIAVGGAAPGLATSTVIGMLHGVGAETPTQVLVFLAAAHVTSTAAGIPLLICFIVGILAANTIVAAIASSGYLSAARSFRIYATLAIATAAASAVTGIAFVTGGTLPAIIGG